MSPVETQGWETIFEMMTVFSCLSVDTNIRLNAVFSNSFEEKGGVYIFKEYDTL